MRFEGETVTCDSCGAEINENDDHSHPDCDEHLCRACTSKQYNEWLKEPCKFCSKPMKDEPEDAYWNFNQESAHKSCAEKLTEQQLEDEELMQEW